MDTCDGFVLMLCCTLLDGGKQMFEDNPESYDDYYLLTYDDGTAVCCSFNMMRTITIGYNYALYTLVEQSAKAPSTTCFQKAFGKV